MLTFHPTTRLFQLCIPAADQNILICAPRTPFLVVLTLLRVRLYLDYVNVFRTLISIRGGGTKWGGGTAESQMWGSASTRNKKVPLSHCYPPALEHTRNIYHDWGRKPLLTWPLLNSLFSPRSLCKSNIKWSINAQVDCFTHVIIHEWILGSLYHPQYSTHHDLSRQQQSESNKWGSYRLPSPRRRWVTHHQHPLIQKITITM